MSRLVILFADLSGAEADLEPVFDDWVYADLLDGVALIDMADHEQELDMQALWIHDAMHRELSLREVLISKRYTTVTLVSIRAGMLQEYQQERFDIENRLLTLLKRLVQQLDLRTFTVGIADPEDRCNDHHFDPMWDLHTLHDPYLIADSSVAILPLQVEHRAALCLLTAMALSGAFRWQKSVPMDFTDPATGLRKPTRLTRVQVRVANAGQYVDRVIAGAFPEGGPWSIPPDIEAVEAPPHSPVPRDLVNALAETTGMALARYELPKRQEVEEVGIGAGLTLFFKHFLSVVGTSPIELFEPVRDAIADRIAGAIQGLTFGEQSQVRLRFKPNALPTDNDTLIRSLELDGLVDPIPLSPAPQSWQKLCSTVFGLMDGGDLPTDIQRPSGATHQWLYTDPNTIGPPPGDSGFDISAETYEILGLDQPVHVGSMDTLTAIGVNKAVSEAIEKQDLEPSLSSTETSTATSTEANTITSTEANTATEESNIATEANDSETQTHEEDMDGTHEEEMDDQDLLSSIAEKWEDWQARRNRSLLWHLGLRLDDEIKTARQNLDHAYSEVLQHKSRSREKKQLDNKITVTGNRLRKWARIFLLMTLITILTSLFLVGSLIVLDKEPPSIFESPPWLSDRIPWIFLAILALVLVLMVFRLVTLTRDHARLLLERDNGLLDQKAAIDRLNHYTNNLRKSENNRDQFNDWQAIIRYVVHAPYTKLDTSMTESEPIETDSEPSEVSTSEVSTLPQSFVYATAYPEVGQLRYTQNTVLDQAMHRGWLSVLFSKLKEEWEREYRIQRKGRAHGPEHDNSPSGSVRRYTGAGQEPIHQPREDFRRKLLEGYLNKAAAQIHTETIAELLKKTEVHELLPKVQVTGPGKALNGMSPEEFLCGLGSPLDAVPKFEPLLFGSQAEGDQLRADNVKLSIPAMSATDPAASLIAHTDVEPGREVLFASLRIVMSDPVNPEVLSFYDPVQSSSADPESRYDLSEATPPRVTGVSVV